MAETMVLEKREIKTAEVAAEPTRKIFVGIPSYDKKVFVPCVVSLMKMMNVFLLKNLVSQCTFEVGMPWLSMARNNLVKKFLATDYTDFVFIDADLGFSAEGFEALALADEEVIAGVYPKKQDLETYACNLKVDKNSHPVVVNGAIEANGLPTGFMKIRRSAFEKLIAAYPDKWYIDPITNDKTWDFFNLLVKEHKWFGDDYGFCHLWTELGEKLWALPNIDFIHSGGKEYTGNLHVYMAKLGDKEMTDRGGVPGWTSENTPKE
jgi:hypothetical protein